ncbi:SpoIIE family protein phosphatase [Desulfovibrio sp. OttesenSCG-928-G15]|nr:SpoIIE family protein phosphatase [Desulfovibrio sp. OttesenSCG-928-G15]
MNMLETIRAKMIFVVLSITAVLAAAIFAIGHGIYHEYMALRMSECRSQVLVETTELKMTVHHLTDSARKLALSGELLYHSGAALRDGPGRYAVLHAFTDTPHATGGGIWFRPDLLPPQRQRVCYYAYSDNGSVIFDESFSSPEYDYPTQQWYTEIADTLKDSTDSRQVVWVTPYVDDSGAKALMTTVGCGMFSDAGTPEASFIGLSTVDWCLDNIAADVAQIRPTQGSFALFADTPHDYILALSDPSLSKSPVGESLSTIPWYSSQNQTDKLPESLSDELVEREIIHNGKPYLSYSASFENGMVLVVNVPLNELFHEINSASLKTLLALLVTGIVVVGITWMFLVRFISRPVNVLSRAATQIGAGNLDYHVPLENRDEFGMLATLFNKMTHDLKKHIAYVNLATAEKERYATELSIARAIQTSMLPCIFPPFPERKDVDLFAFMAPAKEVGGDFYDFFFIDETKLAMVIADVSDKGVPAALFMVITKTLFRDNALPGLGAQEVLRRVNVRLHENNTAGMFVTAVLGILDLENGEFSYSNAGHNPLCLMRGGEGFAPLPMPPGLILGIMPDIAYEVQSVRLVPGDALFFYTDGVTEAENTAHEFYTDKRLVENLNAHAGLIAQEGIRAFLNRVREDLDAFSAGAEQHDDTTMLAVVYFGGGQGAFAPVKEERVFPAETGALHDLLAFVDEKLGKAGCPQEDSMRFALAVEEMFVNIATYAYGDCGADSGVDAAGHCGEVVVLLEIDPVTKHVDLHLVDSGKPFNPLEREMPDPTLPPEQRGVGGMGIFLAKNITEAMEYRRNDNANELVMRFVWA